MLIESTDSYSLLSDRHPVMTLLSGPTCVLSHCCRIVLLEKDIEHSIEYVTAYEDPAKLDESNLYGETPTLKDRDLTLHDSVVIIEYLDERFPHPPLLPVSPVSRAKVRLMISRMVHDWLKPLYQLQEDGVTKPPLALRKKIHDELLVLAPLFVYHPFFLGEQYTTADAYITPLLWRLPSLGIDLPKPAKSMLAYAERMFKRPAFTESLSPQEMELREVRLQSA